MKAPPLFQQQLIKAMQQKASSNVLLYLLFNLFCSIFTGLAQEPANSDNSRKLNIKILESSPFVDGETYEGKFEIKNISKSSFLILSNFDCEDGEILNPDVEYQQLKEDKWKEVLDYGGGIFLKEFKLDSQQTIKIVLNLTAYTETNSPTQARIKLDNSYSEQFKLDWKGDRSKGLFLNKKLENLAATRELLVKCGFDGVQIQDQNYLDNILNSIISELPSIAGAKEIPHQKITDSIPVCRNGIIRTSFAICNRKNTLWIARKPIKIVCRKSWIAY